MIIASTETTGQPTVSNLSWQQAVARFQRPSLGRSVWQIVNTLGLYAVVWYLMCRSLTVSYWITVPLAILAGGLLVRVFIIHHDCGHGAFFKSRQANDIWGFITGVLTFTPYYLWRWEHAIHHAHSGDLDRRGVGAVWTLTVQEYLEASRWKRAAYRLARNPVLLFFIAPLVLFVVIHRFPNAKASKRERHSTHWTNLAMMGVAAVLSSVFGLKEYVLLQVAVLAVAGSAGVWLFYVQHQFEGVYWRRHGEWDYVTAALQGSSYYKLPKVLQWFSGNIGFHHIHHLSPRIPNYNLPKCHRSTPLFQSVRPLLLLASFKSLTLRLWDEQRHQLVGFGHLRTIHRSVS